MKTITKLMAGLLFVAAVSFTNGAKAQTMDPQPWRLGFGVESGIPTETIRTYSKWVFGATARLQYTKPGSNVSIMLTSGYYNFYIHNFTAPTTTLGSYTYNTTPHNLGVIPVKLGVKAFATKGLYFNAEGGVGFETSYNEDKKLILSPGIGWAGSAIDINLRYESLSGGNNNYGLVGLRIAYGFPL